MEPPVSVPVAARQRRAETAAAEPPEEPPGTNSLLLPLAFHGLITLPNALVVLDEPIANSSRFVLPNITLPACQSFAVTVDSYCGTKPFRILDAAVVCVPLVQKRSLMASGMPSSVPAFPSAIRLSAASASAIARSGVVTMNAFSFGFNASIFARYAFASSLAEIFFAFRASRASVNDRLVSSLIADHFRYDKAAILTFGRIGDDIIALMAVGYFILAPGERCVGNAGKRRNIVGVHFAELFDPG